MPTQPNRSSGKRPTLRDVAALAGVDISAVSRLVNNDPKLSVSQQTRERIIAAVAELNYRPNLMAKSLRESRTFTLGLVLPDLANPMYASIIRGAQTRAETRGYGLVLGSELLSTASRTFARLLEDGRVDGLLVATGSLGDGFVREAAAGSGPVVLVNRRVPGVPACVVVDDKAGSRRATLHLIANGHRRIAGLIGPEWLETSQRRRAGFEDAIRAAPGCEPTVLTSHNWTAEAGYRCALGLFELHPKVTAAFVSTQLMSLGTLRAAHESGIAVPEDFSIVCLHDSEVAEYAVPQLTTVAMPTGEMGATAVDVLIELIEGQPPRSVMIPGDGQLIERHSVAARA